MSACRCGQESLSDSVRWVTYADTVHTQARCGTFRELSVRVRESDLAPILSIYWPRTPTEAQA